MKRFWVPLLLTFLFVFESLFVQLVPGDLFKEGYVFVPRFLIISIFFLTMYGSVKHGLIYGFIFGLLYDMVYTEIIGIYLFMFPLSAYIFSGFMRILQTNILVVSFVSIICVALLEAGVYQMNLLIHITDMDFSSFSKIRLIPTLILNFAFIILLAYPLKRLFEKFSDSLRND
ncbi:rod shape-determining protein MreD [Mesobacillus foraminis]|uniref:rod shape-determining protein MreD n=1 Tax=Mesobacillus foraminis TaxID=279826 RepID=UPI001BE56C07|nr:rod shape-determining protein MreD [Mesobacillus foraminis]MBT2754577.1 rod shape-determining protein MreD [Mesobacillus foraminis]